MPTWVLILFLVFLFLIWVISGGYITQASIYLTPYKNLDDFVKSAYWYTFWAAFITWSIVALAIIVVVLGILGLGEIGGAALAGGGEAGAASQAGGFDTSQYIVQAKKGGFTALIILIIAMLVLGLISGILATLAAVDLTKSTKININQTSRPKTAYTDCIVAACLCVGGIALSITGIIIYLSVKQANKDKIKKLQQAQVDQEKELKALQLQLLTKKLKPINDTDPNLKAAANIGLNTDTISLPVADKIAPIDTGTNDQFIDLLKKNGINIDKLRSDLQQKQTNANISLDDLSMVSSLPTSSNVNTASLNSQVIKALQVLPTGDKISDGVL